MRLDRIKLAGFKSFVDPTTLMLKSNRVGIVGPNGCGKSNIIDAVRWVMGESSAKHLRGETMADVIFNGSSSRKPVGMASVELIFDNSGAPTPSPYASYQEISIKRQVSRDGQSVYLLNGSRCRRKDIIDIFLGTGLGARSYAIIEQGTISRLIEARPDELREVIEEAAGISKYKERRHEAEIRMRHTRENLDRLQDLRDEVAKRLDQLQRQAQKAEQYAELKQQQRRLRQEVLALRWRNYNLLYQRDQADIAEIEQALDALAAEQQRCDESLHEATEQQQALQRTLNTQQGRFYALSGDISRLDHTIKHAQKLSEEKHRELERLAAENKRLLSDHQQDKQQVETIRQELTAADADYRQAQAKESRLLQSRIDAERSAALWRESWDQLKNKLAGFTQQAEVQRARIRQLEDQIRQSNTRHERLIAEQHELEKRLTNETTHELTEAVAELTATRNALQVELKALSQAIAEHTARLSKYRLQLNRIRHEWHPLRGRIASLEVLQCHAMGKDKTRLTTWLDALKLGDVRRLAEYLAVCPGWETATENVLNVHLQAVCLEDAGQVVPHLTDLPEETVAFFEMRPCSRSDETTVEAKKLIDHIQSPCNLQALLSGVYCANDVPSARALCARLKEGESVVTPDGTWLGPGWIVCNKKADGKAGILQRERELRDLKVHERTLEAECGVLEQQSCAAEQTLKSAEIRREELQRRDRQIGSELAREKTTLGVALVRREQTEKRLVQLDSELKDSLATRSLNAEQRAEAERLLLQADRSIAQLAQEELALSERQRAVDARLQQARSAYEEARAETHRLSSCLDTLKSSESFALKQMARAQHHCEETAERLIALEGQLAETGSLDREVSELERLISERSTVEQALSDTRSQSSEAEAAIRVWTERRIKLEHDLDERKQQLARLRLQQQSTAVRQQTVCEQLEELQATPEQILAGLEEEADDQRWQERINQVGEKIAKLGAINLVAIEEFKSQTERLQFLDQQHQDLTQSMAMLAQAIQKIDGECKARFRETFDRINAGLNTMFPKLFGGGEAYLELDDRDLLETGVSIMARPPGKRNASIHLLSGGEKALTAVALVFAVFELNPAPFCLLDEVDAPLDDANVGRFSQLVKDMSETVQFLFVSHNKATMEIAEHLTGVTMKEPGVSRIVAVDIDEAVKLAVVRG